MPDLKLLSFLSTHYFIYISNFLQEPGLNIQFVVKNDFGNQSKLRIYRKKQLKVSSFEDQFMLDIKEKQGNSRQKTFTYIVDV